METAAGGRGGHVRRGALERHERGFQKAVSSIGGANDDIVIPRNSTKTDWEVELGVVIGTRASYVREHEALDFVAGYVTLNDVSERAFQMDRGAHSFAGAILSNLESTVSDNNPNAEFHTGSGIRPCARSV